MLYHNRDSLLIVMEPGKTLVLCVDRDDDIGYKSNVISPVIGRAAALDAALQLGLADPEDSDTNAILAGIRMFDDLVRDGEDAEIAIITGDHMNMLAGDRKIASSLDYVITETNVTQCIVISDGAEDEFVIPVIQSKIPITSVRRVIVNQMPNLEGTYYIIKKVISDQKIARFLFVPLGLAMLLYAASYLLGFPQIATTIVIGVIGFYLLYRGLGLDAKIRNLAKSFETSLTRGNISFMTYFGAVVLVIIGIIMGIMTVLKYYSQESTLGVFAYVLTFLYGAVEWATFAGVIATLGVIMDNFLYDRENLGKVVIFPFFVGAMGLIVYCGIVYLLAVSSLGTFPITPDYAFQYITYGTFGGIIIAFTGIVIRNNINKSLEKRDSQNIIDVIDT